MQYIVQALPNDLAVHTRTSGQAHYLSMVDDFMSLVIPISQEQLRHVTTAVMTGIHDVFPPDNDDSNDPISEKKMIKEEGQYSNRKTYWGSTLTARQKPCGARRQNGKSC
jgi:hypothetical protein